MNRRSFLGKAAAAPIVAKEAVAQASTAVPGSVFLGLDEEVVYSPEQMFRDHLIELVEKHRGALHRRRMAVQEMPSKISERKSWSTAFKEHLAAQNDCFGQGAWDMSNTELMQYLVKRGIEWGQE